jgi:hypothetical protein
LSDPGLLPLLLAKQRRCWQRGQRLPAEAMLQLLPTQAFGPLQPQDSDQLFLALIAGELLLREELGERPTLEEYLQRFPHLAEPLRRQFELRGSAAPVGSATDNPPSTLPFAGPGDAQPLAGGMLGRYVLGAKHAEGGLGEVFVAHDTELNRDVALKRIKATVSSDDGCRRFLVEGEVTGRLEHPGVVPVYGLGHDDAGRPFYAMRFVRGETLYEAIQRFHVADGPSRDPGERGKALRELLGQFVAVCNTVAYAHSRGILHRDLKPANVLLGPYGETLVVDWGLAKPFRRDEQARTAGEESLAPASLQDGEQTQQGQAIGTPQYMSPEQAAGRWDVVGPASDVYSLGATLYALLTGVPPIEGRYVGEVLEKVRQGEFRPPGQRKAGVPRALEAVCLKAMALKPEDRYATALDLAAEVKSWLADEPVQAYREPLPTRFGRWARRHRPLVAGAVAVLAAAVAFLGVLVVVVNREREQTDIQRRAAETAREEERTQRLLVEEALYFNHIALADRERVGNNFQRANDVLEQCAPERRHWEWYFLKKFCQGELFSTTAHHGRPLCRLARSPDGRHVATGSGNPYQLPAQGEITIWEEATRRPVWTSPQLPGAVMSFQFSPDGDHLIYAACSFDVSRPNAAKVADLVRSEVGLWNWKTSKRLFHLPGGTAAAFLRTAPRWLSAT